jgi:hypothetical protein
MKLEAERLREQAERAKWWARSIPDPKDRERLQVVARDYEEMAEAAEHDRKSKH